jgi:katanin p60 ATPase-containing subunit A1
LIENGYVETAERLQNEAGSVIGKFDAADNVDMPLIFSEFEAYYEMRFDKKPKLVRKLQDGEDQRKPGRPPRLPDSSSANSSSGIRKSARDTANKKDSGTGGKLPSVTGATPSDDDNSVGGGGGLGVQGTSMGGSSVDQMGKKKADDAADRFEERFAS